MPRHQQPQPDVTPILGVRMSLNEAQIEHTSRELYANFELAGLTPAEVQADLHFTERQLEETLEVTPESRPGDVWLLRDYLEQTILGHGGTPVEFTVLTEAMRVSANEWFGLNDASAAG